MGCSFNKPDTEISNSIDKQLIACNKSIQPSLLVQRVRLLIYGYLRENVDIDIESIAPVDIITECTLWLTPEIDIHFNEYIIIVATLPLQIWIEGDDLNNIINPSFIQKYRVNFIKIDSDSLHKEADEYCLENKTKIETEICETVYPFKCLSFMHVLNYRDHKRGYYFVKINALNDKDQIIVFSKWVKLEAEFYSLTYEYAGDSDHYEVISKFWDDKICSGDIKSVDVDQWIKAIMGLKLVKDKDIASRLFYYILFKNGKTYKGKDLLMDVNDFDGFVSDSSYGQYTQRFARFIRKFWFNIQHNW